MSVYAAIDLHSNNSVLAVLDESDRVLRQRRLPNELPAILRELEPFHDELAGVVVESTYDWYWLVDGLMAHGHRVHLAHTSAVPQYAGLKHADDESDARRRIAATWTDPMATDVCLGAIRSRARSAPQSRTVTGADSFRTQSKHRGSRQQANAGVYFYLAIKSKAGGCSLFDAGGEMVTPFSDCESTTRKLPLATGCNGSNSAH